MLLFSEYDKSLENIYISQPVVDINLGPQFEEVEAQLQRISYFLESINNALLNFTDALKKHEEKT